MAGGVVLTATVPTFAVPSTSSRDESTFRSKSKPVAKSLNARVKCAAKPAGVRRGHHLFVEDTFQIASPDLFPEEPPGRYPGFVEETPSRTRIPEASVQLCQMSPSATWRSRCSPPRPFKKVFHPSKSALKALVILSTATDPRLAPDSLLEKVFPSIMIL